MCENIKYYECSVLGTADITHGMALTGFFQKR